VGIEINFSEEEVFKALHDCYGDKSPGLDGMTMVFLQANWDNLKVDFKRLFNELFHTRKFVGSLSATFIGLITKKASAEDI